MDLLINFMDVTGFDCGGADVLRILKFVFTLIDVVLFIVPIGLIVIVMVDFAKNVIAGKEDEMKKNFSIAIKRILYCVVIFFVDDFSYFAVELVGNAGVEAADKAYSCIDIAKTHDLSQYEMNYVDMKPKKEAGASCKSNNECLSNVCDKDAEVCVAVVDEDYGYCFVCESVEGNKNIREFEWSYDNDIISDLTTKKICRLFERTDRDTCLNNNESSNIN